MNDVLTLLQAHRSIRKFTAEPVSDQQIHEIVRCGQAAATSSNAQAVTIIRVRDTDKRLQLATLAGGQDYVASAGAFLVFCADLHRGKLACEAQGGVACAGMTEHFILATVDVALAAQPQAVSELLGLPQLVYPVFGLCLGTPAQDPEVKPRLPLAAVLGEDSYPDAGMLDAIQQYDAEMRAYYRKRTGGTKDSCWSLEMKALVGKEARPHMRAFLAERGFTLK